MDGIYDDGATYGPNPDAQRATDAPSDPIYDDGAQYGWERWDYTEKSDVGHRRFMFEQAAVTMDDGLDRLFRRLGPPPAGQ